LGPEKDGNQWGKKEKRRKGFRRILPSIGGSSHFLGRISGHMRERQRRKIKEANIGRNMIIFSKTQLYFLEKKTTACMLGRNWG